ncbi:MAG: signal peptide-containing protein [Fuerstiella sp.]
MRILLRVSWELPIMLRLVKYGFLGMLAVAAAGFFVFGTHLPSYLATSGNAAQQVIRDSVPVEFELKRAKQLIEEILPDLQSQIRMIAQEEVEIASLKKDILKSEKTLGSDRQLLADLRQDISIQTVSYRPDDPHSDRQRMTTKLAQRFRKFKQGELTLASKQRLLEKRQDGLDAALGLLDKMRDRKAELELKVEALAAQHRLVQASAVEMGSDIDQSRLADADQLLNTIENRLEVAERVLQHEQDLYVDPGAGTLVDEESLLAELDEYLDH